MVDRMGLDSAVLHYLAVAMASYGECTQIRMFETHANLLAYLTN